MRHGEKYIDKQKIYNKIARLKKPSKIMFNRNRLLALPLKWLLALPWLYKISLLNLIINCNSDESSSNSCISRELIIRATCGKRFT